MAVTWQIPSLPCHLVTLSAPFAVACTSGQGAGSSPDPITAIALDATRMGPQAELQTLLVCILLWPHDP